MRREKWRYYNYEKRNKLYQSSFPPSLYFALFSSLIFRLSPISERQEQPVTMATVTGERQL